MLIDLLAHITYNCRMACFEVPTNLVSLNIVQGLNLLRGTR
jgi:hypothetical protein